jgi:uracil-DNA glycosylase family protein
MPVDQEPRPPAPVPPDPRSLQSLARSLPECRACDLWEGATQVVAGEGPPDARLVLVGEQPGDREDIEGRPFVGPAGRVLAEGLERAGISREEAFVTNAVKHFRYRARGRRRIHQRPDRWQVNACLPWLQAEVDLIEPDAVVALGAVAAQALLGPSVRVGRDRGRPLSSPLAELVTVTAHPSAILRERDAALRNEAMEAFASDLAAVAAWLRGESPPGGESLSARGLARGAPPARTATRRGR